MTSLLFGDDLQQQLNNIKASNKISQVSGNVNKSQKAGYKGSSSNRGQHRSSDRPSDQYYKRSFHSHNQWKNHGDKSRGAYTGAVKAYLKFSICKLLTFSCAISLYFAQTLLRNGKLARGCQNQRNFALNIRGALKLRRVSSPDLASRKCCAFLGSTSKRAAAAWGVGERDG